MRKKILVVEDTTDTRDLLYTHLNLEGFQVELAKDGLEGLEKARAVHPHVIITDLKMPNLDGAEMIARLRAEDEFKSVKVMAVTAYGSEEGAEAKKAGANLVLHKPLPFDSFTTIVKGLIVS